MESIVAISYIIGAVIGLTVVIGVPALFGFTLARALSRKSTGWIVGVILSGITTVIYGIFILIAVIAKFKQLNSNTQDNHSSAPAAIAGPRTIVATDGSCEFTLPNGWVILHDLNDRAEIQAGCPPLSAFLIALTEDKQDLDNWTLEKFAQFKRASLIAESPATQTQPDDLTVQTWPAKQWTTRKTVDGVRVVYLCTCISTDTHFYYILAWSTNSKFSDAKPVLNGIIESFNELALKPEKPQ